MVQTKKGLYGRSNNPYIEMDISKDSSYSIFAFTAADKLSIPHASDHSLEPYLLKINGTMILDGDITIKGCTKAWTIGRYLQLIKKSAHNVKIGVGLVEVESLTEEEDTAEDDVNVTSLCQCMVLLVVFRCFGFRKNLMSLLVLVVNHLQHSLMQQHHLATVPFSLINL